MNSARIFLKYSFDVSRRIVREPEFQRFVAAGICTSIRSSSSKQYSPDSKQTFSSLFRDSPLCQLGPPENKVVIGEIVDIVEDDAYVDFGFKFLGVFRRPKQNSIYYSRGAKVKVRINDLELSDRFLGSSQDMTLLEADISLVGLVSTPVKVKAEDQNFDPISMSTSKTIIRKSKNLGSTSTETIVDKKT